MTSSNQSGFTTPELIVVVGIIAVLAGLATVNLLGVARKPTLTATVDTLTSDLRQQQTKAMVGERLSSHGVYFGSGQYVLFAGSSYNPGEVSNAAVALEQYVGFSQVSLPNASVVFASGSGEVTNFDPNQHAVTIAHEQSGEQKTIEVNRLGVVTAVQ
ncbi:prepilin-type N-terminal cleavage/methylation domain-containing protein [Candidatus Gottesmanbacteria bacterium]|nr:prepilin-type N-terminal cleavage/methylation domain-containing protein [Candidatus Gottesmanbacteria bacterium]